MKKNIFYFALLTLPLTTSAKNNPGPHSQAKLIDEATTYWVVGRSGTNYILSSSPNPDCGTGNEIACEIISLNPLSNNLAPISHVENQTNGFTIVDRQPPL